MIVMNLRSSLNMMKKELAMCMSFITMCVNHV